MKKISLATLKNSSVKMHDDVTNLENEMRDFIVTGKSNNHAVQIKMDTHHHINEVMINPKWSGKNNELAEALKHAFNDALEQVDNEIELRMSAILLRYTKEMTDEK